MTAESGWPAAGYLRNTAGTLTVHGSDGPGWCAAANKNGSCSISARILASTPASRPPSPVR